MPAYRFFYDASIEERANIFLTEKEHHHLSHVMRGKVGDIVEVVNGCGVLAQAAILNVGKKRTELEITNLSKEQEPKDSLVLIQGIPRVNRLEIILEKATELGATAIYLWSSELCERETLTDKQLERYRQLTIAAMKQCGRLFLPRLKTISLISDFTSMPQPLLFGDLNLEAPWISQALEDVRQSHQATIVIGPEKGLTSKEVHQLKEIGARGVKLHHNTLRTDTASITALAILSTG
ncbi:MAG: 16S rRNA (uracil(1498)-N(3))-methyltransferase [Chlamydiales bacterium]